MSDKPTIMPPADSRYVLHLLEDIPDPEIPVLNILDLGIVRDVRVYPPPEEGAAPGVTVMITPTYNGCPALDVICMTVRMTLTAAGYDPVDVRTTLSPPWSTEWLSDAAKEKLRIFGIAPPNTVPSVCHLDLFQRDEAVSCPRCGSCHTEMVSRFGSTACKALYRCLDCLEPFDYFKSH